MHWAAWNTLIYGSILGSKMFLKVFVDALA